MHRRGIGVNQKPFKSVSNNFRGYTLNPQCRSDQYVLVIKSTSFKAYSHDLSRLYFMLCGNLRDNKAEVCWSVSESKADR